MRTLANFLVASVGLIGTSAFAADMAVVVFFTSAAGNLTTHTHFTDNIVRAGLNYQFH